MPIEQFTKAEFEASLPLKPPEVTWECSGLNDGEIVYRIPVMRGWNDKGSFSSTIVIRSSIRPDNTAADCGKDSIRCWLVDEWNEPLGNKLQHHIARTKNWRVRLTDTLRTLWKIGKLCVPCNKCGSQLHVLRVSDKSKPTHNQLFLSCPACKRFVCWIKDKNGVILKV